jgi:hypothetical protein
MGEAARNLQAPRAGGVARSVDAGGEDGPAAPDRLPGSLTKPNRQE